MSTRVEVKAFSQLSRMELYEVMVLRNRVFVVGQKITAEAEVDGLDPQCHHALLWSDDRLVGTARLFMDDDPVKVGRVAVDTTRQRRGLGTELMKAVQEFLGEKRAALHAQAYLEDWYRSLGWIRRGDIFEEAEIPHILMEWSPENNEEHTLS